LDEGVLTASDGRTPALPGENWFLISENPSGQSKYLIFKDPEPYQHYMAEWSILFAGMNYAFGSEDKAMALISSAYETVKNGVTEIIDEGLDAGDMGWDLFLSMVPDSVEAWLRKIADNARKYAAGAVVLGGGIAFLGLKIGGLPGLIILVTGGLLAAAGVRFLVSPPKLITAGQSEQTAEQGLAQNPSKELIKMGAI
jgi:hypothetical protein